MAVTADASAPYGPPSTVLEIITRYRDRGLPIPITKEVLVRAGIAETIIPRVLQSLQTLDLINAEGQPTQVFEGIRRAPQAEYQQRLTEWLNAAYADALNFVDPATADETQVRDAFRNYNPVGQQARMVSLFMGLYAAAGVRTESAPKATKPRSLSLLRPPRKIQTVLPRASSQKHSTATARTDDMPPALAGLLASLPLQRKGWTKGERERFVTTFSAVLDFCFPIITEEQAADVDEGDENDAANE